MNIRKVTALASVIVGTAFISTAFATDTSVLTFNVTNASTDTIYFVAADAHHITVDTDAPTNAESSSYDACQLVNGYYELSTGSCTLYLSTESGQDTDTKIKFNLYKPSETTGIQESLGYLQPHIKQNNNDNDTQHKFEWSVNISNADHVTKAGDASYGKKGHRAPNAAITSTYED